MLRGGAPELFEMLGSIPPWAYLNRVAHEDPSQLEAIVASFPVRPNWDGFTALLAAELLETSGGDPVAIERLQRECLIPMELEMLRSGRPDLGHGAGPLLHACQSRLRAHPWGGRPT